MIKPLPMPERRITEADIEKYLRKRVKELGGEAYKWSSPGNRGVPDRIVVLPGKDAWFIELKAPDGRMSKLQNLFFTRMVNLGFRRARVFWNKEQIDDWLKEEFGYE